MFNKFMFDVGREGSVIRELNDFGKQRAKSLGKDYVFDFSIGDPCVPAPHKVQKTIAALAEDPDTISIHGYTSAHGLDETREAVSRGIQRRFDFRLPSELIYMTCGASAALAISINALCESGDEFILCAPYFTEYPVYVKAAGGTPISVPFTQNFDIDLDAMEAAITPRTKAVIVNSPNNPSGKIYSQTLIEKLSALLERKSEQLKTHIYIISDEPYRELAYDGATVPYIPLYYANTVVCYSYSKTLSLPGERIGYVAVSPKAYMCRELFCAIQGAGRALGYVCAPALAQRVVAKCEDAAPDLAAYAQNRKLMYDGLIAAGFECAPPDGAFYILMKAPDGDSKALSLRARDLGLLIVPGDDFAAKGYCRVAYCVDKGRILRSLPLFKTLREYY